MLKEEDIKKIEELGPSRFTFNGNIIKELGKESISNPYIAVAELIKNSYDADAKKVSLRFENLEKHNTKIIISDDGKGMDFTEIRDKFMDIGSPHKRGIEKTEEHGRIPVGAKGIGRFASHCLGNSMNLITASKNETYGYRLLFDWEKFSKKNKVTDVDIDTHKFKKKKSTRGTTIVLENLKEEWNFTEKLKNLLRDINILTSPLDTPKNFKINNNIFRECKDLKKINKKFLDKAAYHLNINLRKKKEIDFKFYKNNKLIKKDKKVLQENLNCGDTKFNLYFYYKSTTGWRRWIKNDFTKKDLGEIKSILDEYGGIKLYRDKFRVKPYGDKKADWVGLDKWARDNSMVPGNTQTFGIVSIGRDSNPKIEDTTTREGVINNPEFFDLVKFVTTVIKLFVDLRGGEEKEKAKAKKRKKQKKKAKKEDKKMEVEEPKVEEPSPSAPDVPFIDVKGEFPNTHYNQFIYEANKCENEDCPNAAFWMCRKITENLVFHILEKKFPKKVDLWYYTKNKRNNSFSKLIDNLYLNRDSFKPNVKDYIEQFKIDVGKFKKDVDAAIHKNYVYLLNKEELKKYKITKIIQLLIDIYQNV